MVDRRIVVLFVLLGLLVMAPSAMAMPDPFATLVVWPVGEEGEGPLVETSPVDLIIYNNDNSHVLDDLWLLLVINHEAYTHLNSIFTDTGLTFPSANSFEEIPASESPSYRIPPTTAYSHAAWIAAGQPAPYAYMSTAGWPGIEYNDQYDVGSLRDKLSIAADESMYYSVGDLDSHAGWPDPGDPGLNKGDGVEFTLTVDVGGYGGDWKVLVLALGHSDDYPWDPILNVMSPYTKSTLVIVSEPGTILLALASISALGLYKIRHKIRKKQE